VISTIASMPGRASLLLLWTALLGGAGCQQLLGIPDVTGAASVGGSDAAAIGPDGAAPDLGPAADAALLADTAVGEDAAPDALLMPDARPCLGMAMMCGGVCINPANSAMHCGECNHSCGGGACVGGVCQPAVLVDGMHVNDLAVDPTGLFFTTGKRVLECAKTGCGTLAPRQVADMPMETSLVHTGNGSVFFISAPGQSTIRPTLYSCPLAGCPTPVPTVAGPAFSGPSEVVTVGDDVIWLEPDGGLRKRTCAANGGACGPFVQVGPRGLAALSASPTEVFFRDTMANGYGLAKCPSTGCAPAPAVPTKLTTTTPTATVFFQGLIYLQITRRPELPEGSIETCTATDCNGGKPKVFVNGRMGPTNLVVDRTGVYWLESLSDGISYAIRTCPLTGCVGGPRLLADGTKARSLGVDDGFVYWIDGAPGDAGPSPIKRVAK
jgi:hypothetical protein